MSHRAQTNLTVLVVGGGATGVGVARDLAMRGLDVTLVERDGLAAGTSGRSHGVLHSGARYADSDPDGARECIRENRIVRSIAGEAVAETGGLFVSREEDDAEYFRRKREACERVGIDTEELSPGAARELAPGLGDETERVLGVPDAVVYPSRLVAATAASARDHGASIRTHTPLRDLHVEDGEVVAADVGEGGEETLEPDFLVNAAGAWAGECAALAGLDVSMRPTRGVMVGVEYSALSAVLNRCRPPAAGDIAVPHASQAVLGTTSVAVDDPDDYERADWEVGRTIEECAAMVPALADCEIERTYWGVRPLYEPDERAREADVAGERNEGKARGISRGFALLDHAGEGVGNMASIVGGKLTTHRLMAEATADHLCECLGIDAECSTAEEALPGANDAAELDRLVREFDASGAADADVVGRL